MKCKIIKVLDENHTWIFDNLVRSHKGSYWKMKFLKYCLNCLKGINSSVVKMYTSNGIKESVCETSETLSETRGWTGSAQAQDDADNWGSRSYTPMNSLVQSKDTTAYKVSNLTGTRAGPFDGGPTTLPLHRSDGSPEAKCPSHLWPDLKEQPQQTIFLSATRV